MSAKSVDFFFSSNFVSFRLLVFVVVDGINNLTDFMLVNIFSIRHYTNMLNYTHVFTLLFERKLTQKPNVTNCIVFAHR